MSDNNLHWEFDDWGTWTALSSFLTGTVRSSYWSINVCEDGTFSVSESDPELTDRRETFATSGAAQRWCRWMDIGLSGAIEREKS